MKPHFRYRKVTPELFAKMCEMRRAGESYPRIAEACGVDYSTVAYHLDDKQRRNTLNRARKALKKKDRRKTPEQKKYNVKYYKNRYRNDPEFRRKVIRANQGFKFRQSSG